MTNKGVVFCCLNGIWWVKEKPAFRETLDIMPKSVFAKFLGLDG